MVPNGGLFDGSRSKQHANSRLECHSGQPSVLFPVPCSQSCFVYHHRPGGDFFINETDAMPQILDSSSHCLMDALS